MKHKLKSGLADTMRVYRQNRMNISGDIKNLYILPYILKVKILGYLQTPRTGGFPHPDEAIFGIFLIVMNLHRHSGGTGYNSYHFSIFGPPPLTLVPLLVHIGRNLNNALCGIQTQKE